jgi:uncharacterized protein YcbK (DUF882 family)
VALAASATASAQPPAHVGKHGAPSASHAPTVNPNGATAAAYLSGKQAMVGWHASSTREATRDASGRPMLVLTTINRNETLAIPSSTDDGTFCAMDLDRVAHLLRAASGDEHPMDPRTLALVYGIQVHFAVPEIRVVSGYRVPRPGSRSNHGKGRAVDLVVPGVADEEVARYARELGFVGVGVYPSSQFVHVDVRPRSYFWVDFSGPHMKNRERGILGELAAKSDAEAVAHGRTPIEPYAVATDVEAALRARGMAVASAQAEEDEDED